MFFVAVGEGWETKECLVILLARAIMMKFKAIIYMPNTYIFIVASYYVFIDLIE